MDGYIIVTYYGTELGSPEGWTERTAGGKLEFLFLGGWLGSQDGNELGTGVGNELGFYAGKVPVTTLVALDRLSLGT